MKSVITCDMEGRVLTMNDDAVKIFGYEKEEIVGKKRVSIFSIEILSSIYIFFIILRPKINAATNIKLYQRIVKKPKSIPNEGSQVIDRKFIFIY